MDIEQEGENLNPSILQTSSHTQKTLCYKAFPTDTRDRLIYVAKHLFADKGYEATTIKDLADLAKVNISLISYYFSGKEGLYRTCLEQLGKARLAVAQRTLQPPHSIEELKIRLQMFTEEFLSCYLEEPEVSRIIMREVDFKFAVAKDIFQNTFLKVYETLVLFFKSAQDKGLVQENIDAEITASLVFSGLVQIVQKDALKKTYYGKTIQDTAYREQVVQTAISFWLNGCVNKPINSTPKIA